LLTLGVCDDLLVIPIGPNSPGQDVDAAKRGLPEHRISEIMDAVERLGNLQLLPSQENIEKGDLPFDSWITGRSDAYRSAHLIPYTPELWTASMLPEFVRSREKLIRERLLALTRLDCAR
jgi:hypothetical protein